MILSLLCGAALAQDAGFSFENPAASQHGLYAPAAIPLGKGNGFVSQKELLFTRAGYGLTDSLELTLTASPVNLIRGAIGGVMIEDTIFVGPRFKRSISDAVHLGIGADGVSSFRSMGAGADVDWAAMGYLFATYGDADRSVTLGAGGTWTNDNPYVTTLGFVASLSGQYRLTDRIGLVTETDVGSLGGRGPEWIGVSGVRLLSERFTADLAVLYTGLDAYRTALPWLDVSWHFGRGGA